MKNYHSTLKCFALCLVIASPALTLADTAPSYSMTLDKTVAKTLLNQGFRPVKSACVYTADFPNNQLTIQPASCNYTSEETQNSIVSVFQAQIDDGIFEISFPASDLQNKNPSPGQIEANYKIYSQPTTGGTVELDIKQ